MEKDHLTDLSGLIEAARAALKSLEASREELRQRSGRLLAHQILLDERMLRVETSFFFRLWNRLAIGGKGARRLLGAGPAKRSAPEYAGWVAGEEAALPGFEQHRARAASWASRPLISVRMPIQQPRMEWLEEALRSIEAQSYENWRLCVTVDGIPDQALREMLERRNIRFTQAAAELASGDYIAFASQDSILSPFALHYFVEALQQGPADLLYCDEDRLDSSGRRVQPVFKPDWSPELALSTPMYPGHLLMVKRERFEELRGACEGAPEHDMALRLSDRPIVVRHVPRVLYHGRAAMPSAQEAGRRAVEDTVRRRHGAEARVEPGREPHTYTVRRPLPDAAALSVILCTRNRSLIERAVDSVRRTAGGLACEFLVVDHQDRGVDPKMRPALEKRGCRVLPYGGPFHFARMNNLAARQARHPYLLFLNDDVEAGANGWCERILGELARPEIGVVGTLLRYPGGLLQHAGIVLALGDGVGHVGRHEHSLEFWPWLTLTREVSAVTGACLGIRAELFERLGGFDPGFPNNYNDVDLCLRVRAAGYRVVCLSDGGLVHREATRAGITWLPEREAFYARWGEELGRGDPFYSPHLGGRERAALRAGSSR